MIEAIVLDWAGTTVDYGSRAPIIAFKNAFAHFGIGLSEETIRQDVGLDKLTHVRKILQIPEIANSWETRQPTIPLTKATAEIYAQFQIEINKVLAETAQLKPGMTDLIKFANTHHIQLATTTGYTQVMLNQILPLAAQQGYTPTYNITSEQTNHVGRPKPDMVALAMQKMHISDPSHVIKVGDTVNDILEGKNAGTISIGVVDGGNLIGLPKQAFDQLNIEQRDRYRAKAAAILKEAGADEIINNIADLIPLIESIDDQQHEMPLLLTPGPLTTSFTVKETMLVDHGTWDDDYKELTQWVRRELVTLGHASNEEYTAVLMQGSGSFGVEAAIGTAIPKRDATLLIAANGAYGERMIEIADYLAIPHVDLHVPEDQAVTLGAVEKALTAHPEVTHFAMVHCETTTGILNPIETIIPALTDNGIITLVDAMSSFGGVPIDLAQLQVDYLITSSNKCVQGVPGFSVVLAKKNTLQATKDNARSLALDLYAQYQTFEEHDGKWRFTSPTHVVYAFAEALRELEQEGGVTARTHRYQANETLLREGMQDLGYELVIDETVQSPIITSFKYPTVDFNFQAFYEYLKNRGFIIYPGKVSKCDSFRIGNIGEVSADDINRLLNLIKTYTKKELQLSVND
ncbi:2-aminoethylphosphonate-pyruvate aminotransferase [Secundilactobacillus silagincola]|uniref:Multifunctional fusion protein n=2 Tax=Secundilactobacillus silagincola TaxID=1714681 RepID=A0A1Z5J0N3_9LACO|nr:2-aminoethylphosphonate-pyruvate aminotransferase [Secundilactobacillus silagincola]